MTGRFGGVLRSQSLAVLALCLAVSGGTAYAVSSKVAPKNSVTSSSIKDGNVRTPDLAQGAVTSPQVGDGTLLGRDLASSTLEDEQVDESDLGELSLAVPGGRGRVSGTGTCDPETTTYLRCAVVPITLVRKGRVLVLGSMTHRPDTTGGVSRALCRVRVDGVGQAASELEIFRQDGADRRAITSLSWVTPQLLEGEHTIEIACSEPGGGTLTVERARVAVVALSAL